MPVSYIKEDPLYGIWRIEEDSEELFSMLHNKGEHTSFLDRVKGEARRSERFASRLLLRELLGREVSVSYLSSGAPILRDCSSCVSISHTKGFVAVIVDEMPTGIDIEYRSDRVMRIRSKFMNDYEDKYIDSQHEIEHLLIHWCAKETLFKIIGQEGVDFREHLHIEPFKYADVGEFVARESKSSHGCSYRMAYHVTPEYVLTYSLGKL